MNRSIKFILFQGTVQKIERVPQKAEARSFTDGKLTRSSNLSKITLERDIIEFEQASQLMSRRIDVMLMTIGAVSNEKDPSKRLEVNKRKCSNSIRFNLTAISFLL